MYQFSIPSILSQIHLMSACELGSFGSPGVESYWKFVNLLAYSMGPFIATFIVNIAIIMSIARALRLRQFGGHPHVHFLQKPDRPTRKETAAAELSARSHSGFDEIREAPVEEAARDVAIPMPNVLQSQTSKLSRVMYSYN